MACLGTCYDLGFGTGRDLSEAEIWFAKAGDAGNADALACLAHLIEGREPELAVEKYRKAAEAGSALAQYGLGHCYRFGKGVEVSPEKAIKWLKNAAYNGVKDAMMELSQCYAEGFGIQANEKEAERWEKEALKI
jgi:TPR repeat protein